LCSVSAASKAAAEFGISPNAITTTMATTMPMATGARSGWQSLLIFRRRGQDHEVLTFVS
jgi:hypothetical protein